MQLKIEMIKYCSIATPNKNVKIPEVRFQEAIEIFVHLRKSTMAKSLRHACSESWELYSSKQKFKMMNTIPIIPCMHVSQRELANRPYAKMAVFKLFFCSYSK